MRGRGGAVGVSSTAPAGEMDDDLAVEEGAASEDLSAAFEGADCLRFLDVDAGVADDGFGTAAAADTVGASGLGGAVSSPSRALRGWSAAPPRAFFCLPSRLAISREALPARRPLRRPDPPDEMIARKLIDFLLR